LDILVDGIAPFELGWNLSAEAIALNGDTSVFFTEPNMIEFLSFEDSQCPSFDLGPVLQAEFFPAPAAVAALEPSEVCDGEAVTLSINSNGFGMEQSVLWSFQGDTLEEFTQDGALLFTWTPVSDDSIELFLIQDTTSGCETPLTDVLTVDHVLFPTLELGLPQEICEGDTVFLGLDLEDDVEYSASEGVAFLPNTEILYWRPEEIGVSTLFMTADRDGCLSSDSLQVDLESVPVPLFSLQPEVIRAADPIFYASSTGSGLVDLWWTLDGDTIGQGPTLNYQLPRDITEDHILCLDARRPLAGCPGRVCRTIEVQGELDIYIPNAFSPDGDGINDLFEVVILNTDPTFFTLEIFDRSGSVIFRSERISQGWDGRDDTSGREMPTGIYPYRLVTRDRFGRNARTRDGFISLLR
jgi:gliding motility-associated-like protein